MTHIGADRAIAAEVDVSVRPDNTEVTALNEGPFSSEPKKLLKAIGKSKTGGSFELRILRIPEVYLMACWLHSKAVDLIVPFDPAPNGLLAGQEYSVRGLAIALSTAIEQLSRQHPDADI
jgi:hypothetical protein